MSFIGGIAQAIGGATAANITAGATTQAAQTQADAATKAAQLQATTAANTLGFQQTQAQQDLATANATNLANYNQWAAKQGRLSDFGQTIGLPAENIPAFSPIPNALNGTSTTPNSSTTTPGGTPASGSTPSGTGNPTDPAFIQSQLQGVYQSLGVKPTGPGSGPTDIQYYANQIAATGGWQGGNASYWTNRIASDVKGGGASGGAAPAAPTSATNSFGSVAAAPQATGVSSPYLSMPLPTAPSAAPVNSFASVLGAP
jgi:hypothetical protein